ncbi:MAG: transketolase [Ruminococcus sp.]|jgi:transketolase
MEKEINVKKIRRFSADIRIQTIKGLAASVGFGHIGGSMSVADVLAVLYGAVMNVRPEEPGWPDRDYLVLSKGHCGPALYAALALKGYYPVTWLETINKPDTRLPSHADGKRTPGIDISTGSLGQGISAAVGIALGNDLQGKSNDTYCIVGDGECQEGQVWEGIMFAVHRKLGHLIIFVDNNKKQLDGPVEKIQRQGDLKKKFASFGCHVQEVCGYDYEEIYNAIQEAKQTSNCPSVIILDTVKGLGCDFAEKESFNHYMTFDVKKAQEACDEIERRLTAGTYPKG